MLVRCQRYHRYTCFFRLAALLTGLLSGTIMYVTRDEGGIQSGGLIIVPSDRVALYLAGTGIGLLSILD